MDRRNFQKGGAWPAEMQADLAAMYVDDGSTDTFLENVKLGLYPRGVHYTDGIVKWSRKVLDELLFKRHLDVSSPTDLTDII